MLTKAFSILLRENKNRSRVTSSSSLLFKCFYQQISYIIKNGSNATCQSMTQRLSYKYFYGPLVFSKVWKPIAIRNSSMTFSTTGRRHFGDSNDTSSSGPNPPPEKLPPLMTFPHIMWPKISYSIRNWFLTNFIIRPHMDKDFDIREFDKGARQALSYVSNCISQGKFDELTGLVSSEALSEIKENAQRLSMKQRELLAVKMEDVYFSFPYQIGIIMPDDNEPGNAGWSEERQMVQTSDQPARKTPQKRYVEITVGFHVLRGLAEQVKAGQESRHFLEFLRQEDTKSRVMVCNYRFWRNFTEGVTDNSWIINMVSHFIPAAELENK